jgi:hypothetical protein
MPHAGELLSILGTLRGEGAVSKVFNSLVVDDPELLTDELGLVLQDETLTFLTD